MFPPTSANNYLKPAAKQDVSSLHKMAAYPIILCKLVSKSNTRVCQQNKMPICNTLNSSYNEKKKYAQILLCYRQLFVKGNIIIGEWGIFGVLIFLRYSRSFVKGDFVIGRVECTTLPGMAILYLVTFVCNCIQGKRKEKHYIMFLLKLLLYLL